MIRRRDFDQVLAVVRRSGVAEDLEKILSPEGRGRPRGLSVEFFLTGAILTAVQEKPLTFINIYETLTGDLARSLQVAIGVRVKSGSGRSQPISIRQVRYLFSAIENRLTAREEATPGFSEEMRDLRRQSLEGIIDRLIAATIPVGYERTISVAVDGTGVESFAKSKWRRVLQPNDETAAADEKGTDEIRAAADLRGEDQEGSSDETVTLGREHYSADRDARAGYRTKTYEKKSTFFFGYDLTAAVAVPRVGGSDIGPKLLLGMRVAPAAQSVTAPALDLLEHLLVNGYDIDEVIADRAYGYRVPEHWALPLLELGLRQVQDIHPNDHGPRYHDGVVMIDGVPHCPSTPERLWNIPRPARLSVGEISKTATESERLVHEREKKAIARFNELIAERETYAFVRHQNAREGAKDPAKARFICPARAGKLRCANCPLSQDYPATTPAVENPPTVDPPRSCRQETVMVPGAALIKLAQKEYWGSIPWQARYGRRSHVEAMFGNLRNPATQNISRLFCRVVGLVKTSLMLSFEAVAANLRLVQKWAWFFRGDSEPPASDTAEDHGFEEIDADNQVRLVDPDAYRSPPG